MSGPKRSTWQIRQEQRERIRRERERRKARDRARQASEISNELTAIDQRLQQMSNHHGKEVFHVVRRVEEWSRQVQKHLDSDLREAWRGLRGIRRYLDVQEARLRDSTARKKLEEKREREHRERVQFRLADLEALEDDARPVENAGIRQRIELFTRAVQTNPDNPRTLEQIDVFRRQVNELLEKHEQSQEELQWAGRVLSEALGGTPEGSSEGAAVVVRGSIEGMPVTARLEPGCNQIDLDTPRDGGCRKAMVALMSRLEERGMGLGSLRVLDSGETIGQRHEHGNRNRKRLDA